MKNITIILTFIFISCTSKLPLEPNVSLSVPKTESLSKNEKLLMNGVYSVTNGSDILGDEIVGRWIDSSWCLYSKHDVVFSENMGGFDNDNSIFFSGYIRLVRSGGGIEISLKIFPDEGALDLKNNVRPANLTIKVSTSEGEKIELHWARMLYDPVKKDSLKIGTNKEFNIIAHRGGGRNSERLGKSENSIEMIKYADILGANGVEIDVKRTRDRKLIIFHDDTFSPRTIQGLYLLGKVENFDLAQIQAFGRLIYNESIPTLKEALSEIIYHTNLKLVWLDIKDPDIVEDVIKTKISLQQNRNVEILLGIPNNEVLNSYLSCDLKDSIDVLIEFSHQQALNIKSCKVWAPRWTNGTNSAEVLSIHSAGKLVFTWTLDVKEYIQDYLYDNEVDGILSNYPSLVIGMEYSR